MIKKILLFILLLFPSIVLASNDIYSIDMDIYIDENGNALIKEKWKVDGSDGTEWYKALNNLGNSEVSNFQVSMDGTSLNYKTWNVNESLENKKGYYGINYTDNGVELCFGKYDYNYHEFILEYNLSNFIFNTDDSQILYWNLIDKLSDVNFTNFSVKVSSYYSFDDTLDVWGYGNDGFAYVQDGVIKMSNNSSMNGQYVVLLVKFPLNTFNTTNTSKYKTFNDVYAAAETGAHHQNRGESNTAFYVFIMTIIFTMIIIICGSKSVVNMREKYGFKDNKTIDKKTVPMFRDIPCNKDLFYANALVKLNNLNNESSSIFGALILKWVKLKKINVIKNEGIFNKEKCSLDLKLNPSFDNDLEEELFKVMYEASKDGILEVKEFEKWAKKNYDKFLSLFDKMQNTVIKKLKSENHIYKRKDKQECKSKNVMDDTLYEESVKLCGLKRFLKEFSSMDKKDILEVHLWDEYLMFAYLFGMADKVAKELKNIYPEIFENASDENSVFLSDFNTIMAINFITTRSIKVASNAMTAATNYSAGGGGFSSIGGGGGSFGGGGGGSR